MSLWANEEEEKPEDKYADFVTVTLRKEEVEMVLEGIKLVLNFCHKHLGCSEKRTIN